jgi:polar amino acid transport system substrate-binding protein
VKHALTIVLAVACLVGAVAASAASPPALLKPGVLLVGAELPTPAFLAGSDTHPTGYAPDLVNEIARRLDVPTVQWREVTWATLWQPATPKTLDFDIDSITITKARAKTVDFSTPYFDSTLALLVRRGAPIAAVRSLKQLRSYRLGGQSWALGYSYLQKLKPKRLISFADDPSAIAGVSTGKVDGLLADTPVAIAFARSHPKLTVSAQITARQPYGLLFAKGSPLRAQVNGVLASMQNDGTLARLQQKWFPGSASLPVIR